MMHSVRWASVALALLAAAPAWAQSGFPVVTHYPAVGGVASDTTRRVMPDYDVYSASVTDEYAPPLAEFNIAAQLIFQTGGAQAVFVNDAAALTEGASTIQVVNNWIIGAALYTIAFPPGWRRSDSRPIFLSPNPTSYSNNFRVFRAQEAGVLGFGATRGFITVFANAGGIESQGVSDGVLRSVGAMFDTLAGMGGDKHRVVAAGFSRGAQDAFVWAANPLGLDYTILAAFGHALPSSALEAVTAPYATYPWLGWLSDVVTNDPARSRYDNVPPPHSLPNRVLQVLTGQGVEEARSASTMIERLRGKQLVFSAATHDPVVPYRTGVAFSRALDAAGIPHQAVFIQNTGHTLSLDVVDEASRALDEIGAGRPYVAPSGRVYAVQNEVQTHDYLRHERVARATMPLSVVLPFRAARGQPMRIDVCGAPGAQYLVCGVLGGTATQSEIYVIGEIPAGECASHALVAPLTLGNYTWNVYVNGTAIPRSRTPLMGLRPSLQVDAVQPGHFEAMPTQLAVQLGISELSPQGNAQIVGCPPPVNAPGLDGGVLGDSGFVIVSDTGPRIDSGPGAVLDAGVADTGNRKAPEMGCGCSSARGAGGDAALFLLLLTGLLWRRHR